MNISLSEIFEKDKNYLAFLWDNLLPKDRFKILNSQPSTVWFFGAGASHHYAMNSRGVKVPLANNFFEAFNSLPTSEGLKAHIGPFINYLYHSRGIKPLDVSQWKENVEDFMTSVESEVEDLKEKINSSGELNEEDFERSTALSTTFNNMTFIFANVINEAQNGPSDSAYHELIKFCTPNDTFISFNWDTLIDRALADSGCWSPDDGYGLSFSSILDSTWKTEIETSHIVETNLKLLKLHGSTNWLVPYTGLMFKDLEYKAIIPEGEKVFLYWQSPVPYATYRGRWRGGYAETCYCYYPPNLPNSAFLEESLKPKSGHVQLSAIAVNIFSPFIESSDVGVVSSPLLITPIHQKKYERYESTIEALWQQAIEALSVTDRIVIIGYSFPLTDVRQLEMLRTALDSRKGDITVEIVDPFADNIVNRIGDEYLSNAKEIITHEAKFEEYLGKLWEEAPNIIVKAAEQYEEVGNWIEMMCSLKDNSPYSSPEDA